jgi:hypothetical protein
LTLEGTGGGADGIDENEEVDGNVLGLEILGDADHVIGAPGMAEEDEGLLDLAFVMFLNEPAFEAAPFFIGDGDGGRADFFIDFVGEDVHTGGEDAEPAAHAVDMADAGVGVGGGSDGLGEGGRAAAGDVHAGGEKGGGGAEENKEEEVFHSAVVQWEGRGTHRQSGVLYTKGARKCSWAHKDRAGGRAIAYGGLRQFPSCFDCLSLPLCGVIPGKPGAICN